ncbi:type II toxin-antitoxin system RelE/ParE family toxin [Modicisalibacter ilicicola]|uniref:type II toxin-antitoxin system RelE/ParE family toxin n=1 Tax=Modicisalibacter ilicicola TaxID=480814 RepID=UPI002481ECDF|nr:type II toxin-antitoxin system RelE/ParE family toxin [Halomonas ilicicola]
MHREGPTSRDRDRSEAHDRGLTNGRDAAGSYGPGYRVYFMQQGPIVVILLCGGDKSTQSKDIAKAKELARKWRDG